MIHNGIGVRHDAGLWRRLCHHQHKKEFALDLYQVAEIWRHGSVVRFMLLDLTAAALKENPRCEGIAPYVADSGARDAGTVAEAIDLDVTRRRLLCLFSTP